MNWTRVVVWLVVACLSLFVAYVNFVEPFGRHPEKRRVTKIMVEIGQLQTAMQSYEDECDEFPPCLADANASDRKVRFMRHLKKAFEHSDYGSSEEAFDRLNAQVQNGFGDGRPGYNFKDAGGIIRQLDLNTVDAAESLVFWLGGFPTPHNPQTKNVIANRRIFGFHRDPDDPMHRDAPGTEGLDPLRYRTDPFFQFDETRLYDADDDGWLEYVPRSQVGSHLIAPFVYFDAKCYGSSGAQPNSLGSVRYPAAGSPLAKEAGFAVPYATNYKLTTSAVTWHNPDSFQIVCGGLDGMYDTPEPDFERRIVVLPAATVYHLSETTAESVSIEESDNLTNLWPNTIESWRQESGR